MRGAPEKDIFIDVSLRFFTFSMPSSFMSLAPMKTYTFTTYQVPPLKFSFHFYINSYTPHYQLNFRPTHSIITISRISSHFFVSLCSTYQLVYVNNVPAFFSYSQPNIEIFDAFRPPSSKLCGYFCSQMGYFASNNAPSG